MRFVMTTQRTLHYITQDQLHFVQFISPTLPCCITKQEATTKSSTMVMGTSHTTYLQVKSVDLDARAEIPGQLILLQLDVEYISED